MERFIIGTTNSGKRREIEALFIEAGLHILNPQEIPPLFSVDEEGLSYLESALKKGKVYVGHLNLPVLTDDSGLEVRALGGAPGISSSTYKGGRNDEERIGNLLKEMSHLKEDERDAIFRCVAVCTFPDGRVVHADGECRGWIALKPSGTGGFGYDPVFIPEGLNRTMAQLSLEEKNRISHRGRAFRKLIKIIKGL